MTLTLKRHPRGIQIEPAGRDEKKFSAIRIRNTFGIPVAPGPHGSLIVRSEFAHVLLEHSEESNLEWDPVLLDLATRQQARRQAQLRARVEVEFAIENATKVLEDYPLSKKLDIHQKEAVAAICVPSLQGIAIFDEQGTGKTLTALCSFDLLRRTLQVDRLLVIAPKSVLSTWQKDAQSVLQDYTFTIIQGNAKHKKKLLFQNSDIIAVSYETAVIEGNSLKLVLSGKQRFMLVIDESYFVKNPKAQRTRLATELRQFCERAVILCGTPAPNSAKDIVQQINIMDDGITFENVGLPKDKDTELSIVKKALQNTIFLRRLKEDVLPNIPPKNIEILSFDLNLKQGELYKSAKNDLVLDVKGVNDHQFSRQLSTFLARWSALLQICSHPGGVDSAYDETPAKHLIIDRILQDLVEQKMKKVVIWSFFRYSLHSLVERYKDYGVVFIDGSVSSVDERIKAIEMFQTNKNINVFVGNPAAAGAGITLTAAHHAIYESLSNQAAHYMQSIDRIHRRGQTHETTYHVLLAANTVEEKEFSRIVEKEMASHELLGDNRKDVITREKFLANLGEPT